MAKYKYLIELTQEYRQFEVVTDYQYPNEGEAILTRQYGGEEKCRVSYRGATEEPQPTQSSVIERYKYLVELIKENRQFEVINDFKYPNEGEAALLAQYGGRDNCRVSFRGSVTGAAANAGSNGKSQQGSSGASQAGSSEDNRKKNNPNGDSILLGLHAAILAFQTGYRNSGLGGALSALTSRQAEKEAKNQIWANKTHKSLRALEKKGISPKPPTTLAPETEGVSTFTWIVVIGLVVAILFGIRILIGGSEQPTRASKQPSYVAPTSGAKQQDESKVDACIARKAKSYRKENGMSEDDVMNNDVIVELIGICKADPNA